MFVQTLKAHLYIVYTIIIYSRVTRTPTLRTNSIWRKFIFLDLSQGVCTTRRRHIRVRRNKRPNNIHKPKQQFSCWMNTYVCMYVPICFIYIYTNMYIYLWKCRTTLARKFLEPNTYVCVCVLRRDGRHFKKGLFVWDNGKFQYCT